MLKANKLLTALMICLIISLIQTGCKHDGPLSAVPADSEKFINDINDRTLPFTSIAIDDSMTFKEILSSEYDQKYPQTAVCNVKFFNNWGEYRGSGCQIPNGSFFEFNHAALTPPTSIPWGEEVSITMKVERDPVNRELVFSFGPSGCRFDPPAKLWMDWSDLGSPNATLFYLKEDGSREEQLPDQIDVYNKHMCIYIDHFSRYAVAYSN